MPAPIEDAFADRTPTTSEIENADQLHKVMTSLIGDDDQPAIVKLALEKGEFASVTLTPAIAKTFLQVLRLVSSGKGFRLLPVEAELTTQQAADLLNVSRPFLIKLLEAGDIPHVKTGRHRRIRVDDLFAYKARRDAARADALADMARIDAEHDLL